MTTQKQIVANRNNSLKSTGPKTSEGKAVISKNALKHGILSQEVLITKGDGKEDEKVFQAFRTQLNEDLKPEGILENILVDKLVTDIWRLRRVVIAEKGIIRSGIDNIAWRTIFNRVSAVSQKHQHFEFTTADDPTSSSDVEQFILVLDKAIEEIQDQGYIGEALMEEMTHYFGRQKSTLAYWIHGLNLLIKKKNGGDTQDDIRNIQTGLINWMKQRKQQLEAGKEMFEKDEKLADEANYLAAQLPAGALNNIQRYETTLERGIFRKLHELQRLQAARKGEQVYAPVTIDVNSK